MYNNLIIITTAFMFSIPHILPIKVIRGDMLQCFRAVVYFHITYQHVIKVNNRTRNNMNNKQLVEYKQYEVQCFNVEENTLIL